MLQEEKHFEELAIGQWTSLICLYLTPFGLFTLHQGHADDKERKEKERGWF